MSFGGDPDYKFPDCRHTSLTPDGYCNECGCRAAIMIRLEKRKPMNEDISYAVEAFEEACDAAIAAIGGGAAGTIFMQRRARFDLIRDREMQEKNVLGGRYSKDPGDLPDWSRQTRGVSEEEATARDARERLKEEQHAEDIKALNKSMGL